MIAPASSLKRAGEILNEIEGLHAELAGLFSTTITASSEASVPKRRGRPPGSGGKGRKMSAEARARISASTKARWARFHAGKAKTARNDS